MKIILMFVAVLMSAVSGHASAAASAAPPSSAPAITGTPTLDKPQILNWTQGSRMGTPDLTETSANTVSDLNGRFSDCDVVLSSAGNYHMALRELWHTVFLAKYASGLDLRNWFFTTTPPVAVDQIAKRNIVFGNVSLMCLPQVAVGPKKYIDKLAAAGYTEGQPLMILRSRGNVLLVKKGNPRHISSIWDLGRPEVRVATPNPAAEKGSFENYSGSIYQIAKNSERTPPGWDADRLFNSVFNSNKDKWLVGEKIHHREVPWSIAYGRADAGVLYYHLALDAVRTFPDLFEIVPLGGTADDPQPLPGNAVETLFAVRIKGDWSAKQLAAREKLMETFASEEFTKILLKDGMQR